MKRPRILVVDDEEDFQTLVRQMLEPGYEILSAGDGVEGLAAMRRDCPDLMILDVNMPLKNGYQVCREARADPAFADLPILLLTIRNRDEEIVRGLEEGADDYLAKPVDPTVLRARIQGLLRRS